MNSLSFLVCPLTGLICDKLSLPRIKSASFIMIFIIVIETTISFLPLIEAPWPVYVMTVLFPIGRTFFYGVSNLVRSYIFIISNKSFIENFDGKKKIIIIFLRYY